MKFNLTGRKLRFNGHEYNLPSEKGHIVKSKAYDIYGK